uniref:Uncharacterized protein n=1 Tax=Rhizophora mucronata TaxID=61149 RepID=A0A2P2J402_RHIMU
MLTQTKCLIAKQNEGNILSLFKDRMILYFHSSLQTRKQMKDDRKISSLLESL